MKTNVVLGLAIALVVNLACAANSFGQDVGLFNGNGIKNQWGEPDTSTTRANVLGQNAHNVLGADRKPDSTPESGKWKLPKFDFSKLKPNLQKPKFMQNNEYPKAFEFSDTDNDGLMSSFPKMQWPARNPSQPSFFQRMNNRTREMFGKTRDGFSDLGQRSRNTWDSLTRGLGGEHGAFSGSRNDIPPPAQPKLRSARQADGNTSKFLP